MANDIRDAWRRVGDELSGLGLKLKLHAQQELSDERDDDDSIFERLEDALDGVIDAIENAADDDAVRADLLETKELLSNALRVTYTQARRNISSITRGC